MQSKESLVKFLNGIFNDHELLKDHDIVSLMCTCLFYEHAYLSNNNIILLSVQFNQSCQFISIVSANVYQTLSQCTASSI